MRGIAVCGFNMCFGMQTNPCAYCEDPVPDHAVKTLHAWGVLKKRKSLVTVKRE